MSEESFWNIPLDRESLHQDGVRVIKDLIESGEVNLARQLIDRNRRQVMRSVQNNKPSGSLAAKLTTLQGMGLINELYQIGDFSGELAVK